MATKCSVRRFLEWYSMLLRLYPQPFRERFGEGMEQTFHDLCREHGSGGRRLFALALWVFCETLVGIVKEHAMQISQMGKTALRVALGALAALMVPLVASQVVEGWNWPPGAFLRVYVLFFLTGMVFALVSRRMGVWQYKAGVGVALGAGFALGWSNMVHVADTGNLANLWYYSVLVVGAAGALLARLKAPGLARTLFVMAALLALISVLVPSGAPPDVARRMAIGHGVYVGLFIAAGFLFRRAALTEPKRGLGH